MYGFNGKEKDDEVNGYTGTVYDYGDRFYDSRVGRWFSADPLFKSTPGLTPYRFAVNNPIAFLDKEGQFEIGIHAEITREVLSMYVFTDKSNWNFKYGTPMGYSFTAESGSMLRIIQGVQDADQLGFAMSFHFDGHLSNSSLMERWSQLNDKINSLSIKENAWELGVAIHNVQDFYAHSNYVETYIQYYKAKNGSIVNLKPEDIPTYDEAMKSDFKNFPGTYTMHTGFFNVWRWVLGIDNYFTDVEHHDDMSKDHTNEGRGAVKPEGSKYTFHQFARAVAKKHTKKIIAEKAKKEKIKLDKTQKIE